MKTLATTTCFVLACGFVPATLDQHAQVPSSEPLPVPRTVEVCKVFPLLPWCLKK